MVKILPSGEIVPDDDPRAQRQSRNRGPEPENRPRQGFVQHDNQGQQGMYQGGQTVSIFQVLNQKLLGAGFPRWNAGPYVVEPIVTVGFILAGLLLGLKGLLFAAILFAVCQWSTQGQGAGTGFAQWFGGGGQGGHNSGNSQRGGVPRRPGGGGPGHRLGR